MRLVSRSDVITAQSVVYLLTERERQEGEERKGWTRREKKKPLKCDKDHQILSHNFV